MDDLKKCNGVEFLFLFLFFLAIMQNKVVLVTASLQAILLFQKCNNLYIYIVKCSNYNDYLLIPKKKKSYNDYLLASKKKKKKNPTTMITIRMSLKCRLSSIYNNFIYYNEENIFGNITLHI